MKGHVGCKCGCGDGERVEREELEESLKRGQYTFASSFSRIVVKEVKTTGKTRAVPALLPARGGDLLAGNTPCLLASNPFPSNSFAFGPRVGLESEFAIGLPLGSNLSSLLPMTMRLHGEAKALSQRGSVPSGEDRTSWHCLAEGTTDVVRSKANLRISRAASVGRGGRPKMMGEGVVPLSSASIGVIRA